MRTRVIAGRRVDAIAEAATRARLVVIGASAVAPWVPPMLGSTVHCLIRKTRRPVLVVRERPTRASRHVVIGVDFVARFDSALACVRALAPDARLHVLHVCEPEFEAKLQSARVSPRAIAENRARSLKDATSRMTDLLMSRHATAAVTGHVVLGRPGVALAGMYRKLGADLVVLVRGAKPFVEEFLLGSMTDRVLADARSDVLVVAA